MNDIVKALKAAKSLIDSPENWTQGAFARDFLGDNLVFD